MRPTDLQSKVIAFMRFPLIVMVLFLHCNFTTLSEGWASLPFASSFIRIFSQHVAPAAIPFFFFISGYLFFKSGQFSPDIYIKKLIHRLQSLFVPYILWNLLYLFLVIIIGLFANNVPIIGIKFDDMLFGDGLKAFWDISLIKGGSSIAAPIVLPFWFVRDLMVTMVFSPLIFFGVKLFIIFGGKRPLVRYVLFLAVILGICYCPDMPGLNPDAWLFFGYGAYYGIKKKEFIVAMMPFTIPALIVLVIVIILGCYFPNDFIFRLQYVVGLVFGMSFTTKMVRSGTWYVNMTYSNGSFFVFATHYMFLGLIIMFLGSGIWEPQNAWLGLLIYILSVALVVTLCMLLYWLMRTRLPFTTYILMGGRR